MAPSCSKHSRRASYQIASIAAVGSRVHFQDSLECYTRSIFYFHPDILVHHHGQCLSILLSDVQHHLRMFSNILMACPMVPTLNHPLRLLGLRKILADINLLHVVVYVEERDAVMVERKETRISIEKFLPNFNSYYLMAIRLINGKTKLI